MAVAMCFQSVAFATSAADDLSRQELVAMLEDGKDGATDSEVVLLDQTIEVVKAASEQELGKIQMGLLQKKEVAGLWEDLNPLGQALFLAAIIAILANNI